MKLSGEKSKKKMCKFFLKNPKKKKLEIKIQAKIGNKKIKLKCRKKIPHKNPKQNISTKKNPSLPH